MASSRQLAGDSTRYAKLQGQDNDSDNGLPPTSFNNQDSSSPFTTPSRSIIRRRPPDPTPSPVKSMSLVGLKNLFFRQTVTRVPVPKSNYGMTNGSAPLDWGNGSRQPLLPSQTSQSHTTEQQGMLNGSDNGDIESQSVDSKTEKSNQKRGFRIDARVISDATIGLSDGLTVPFALTAGLSALGNTKVVIYGGFAELIAGAISMGLGGYLGAKSEASSYIAQREETQQLCATNPQLVMEEINEVFQPYNVPKHTLDDLTRHLANSPRLVDFVMQFQHCEEEPASTRALTSALTIAAGYFLGGLLPLIPYLFVGPNQVYEGLYISIAVMVTVLFIFGYVKTCVVVGWDGGKEIRAGCFGGVQMVIVGSAAAGAAMGLVRLFNGDEGSVGGVGAA